MTFFILRWLYPFFILMAHKHQMLERFLLRIPAPKSLTLMGQGKKGYQLTWMKLGLERSVKSLMHWNHLIPEEVSLRHGASAKYCGAGKNVRRGLPQDRQEIVGVSLLFQLGDALRQSFCLVMALSFTPYQGKCRSYRVNRGWRRAYGLLRWLDHWGRRNCLPRSGPARCLTVAGCV